MIIVSIQYVNKSMDGLFCGDNRIANLSRVLQDSKCLVWSWYNNSISTVPESKKIFRRK